MKLFRNIPFEFYLILIYCLTILIVNPTGEFPLNDDWAYSKSVWSLYENGKFSMNNWPAMTLVAQVYWGTLFCKVISLSFLSLRTCTLITGLAGVIVFYKITNVLAVDNWTRLCATLLVFFNPFFFSLSYSFMTDVHFFSFMLFSIFFFIRYLESRKISAVIWATLFSIIATMIRQPGILIPLSFTAVVMLKRMDLKSIIVSVCSFLLTLSSLLIYYKYSPQVESQGNLAGFNELLKAIHTLGNYQVLTRSSVTLLYTGLFLLPLMMVYWNNIKNFIVGSKLIAGIIIVLAIVFFVLKGEPYPAGNILFNLGLGPKLLKDAYWNVNVSPLVNQQLWVIGLKSVSIIGGVLMLIALLPKKFSSNDHAEADNPPTIRYTNIFLGLIAFGYALLLVISSSYFDRYIIPLPGILSLIIISRKIQYSSAQKYLAIGLLAAMAYFSISATHDYLSWNRARWQAGNYLLHDLNISPQEIDGGFEFNAWHEAGPFNPISKEGKSWWFVTDDHYVISFGPIEGFSKYKSYYYPQYLSLNKDSIFILKKNLIP